MGIETDKIIMRALKRLFRAWLQGTPYTCQGVEILTDLGQTPWRQIFSQLCVQTFAAGSIAEVFGCIRSVFIEVDLDKLVALNEAGDWDGSARASVIGDEMECSESKP